MIGGAFAVAGLAKFGKSCIELASDLNEVNNVTGKAFAGMSKEVDEWAKGAVNAYGLSETMAKSFAGTFGAMAGSFGFTTKEAFKMSTTLAQLSGDIASFYNTTQEEAFTKLKSVFTGETESLKSLGVVMTQTALNQYAMANGFGKTVQQMTEAEKVSLRYAFVLNQLKFAQGDFANTLGSSWANQIRVLSLNFASLKATIGQSLMAVLMPVVKLINTILVGLTTLAQKFNNLFSRLTGIKLDDTTAQVSADLGTATGNADGLTDSLGNANDNANKTSKAVNKLKRQLMGFDKITKLEPKDSSTGGTTGGGGGVVGGGSSVDLKGYDAKPVKELSKIKIPESILKALERLKKALADIADLGKKGLKYIWEKILKPLGKWTINKLAPALVELLASAFELVAEALKIVAPILKFVWEKLLAPLAKLLGKILIKYLEWCAKKFRMMAVALKTLRIVMGKLIDKYVKPFVDKVAPKVKKVLQTIGNFLKETFIKAVANVVAKIKAFVELWDSIKDKAVELLAEAKEKVEGALEWLSEKWEGIKDKGAELLAEAKEKVKGALETLKGKWEGIKDRTTKLVAEAKEKVKGAIDKLKNSWSGFKATTKMLYAEAKEKVDGAMETLKSNWNGLVFNLKVLYTETKEKAKATIADIKKKWDDWKANAKELLAKAKTEGKKKLENIKTAWDNIKAKTKELIAQGISKGKQGLINLKDAWDNIKGKAKELKAKATTTGAKALSKLKETWDGFKTKALNLKATFTDYISSKIRAMWNGIARAINGAIDIINKIPGVSIGKLPYLHLAQGGYVARNTPQLAVIGDNTHEGEIVAPESKLQAMADRASGNHDNSQVLAMLNSILQAINGIDTNAYIDGKKITDVVVKQINQNTRATGKLAIEV